MTIDTLPEEPYLGIPTAPSEIDAGLRALWKENETATRASLMNLAIYSESSEALRINTQCVHQLTLEHACRVLLIEARLTSPSAPTDAWITAHCSLRPDGRKAVCCEQLAFRTHGNSPARLTNLLFANLDSDLPLVLWWQASLSGHFDPRLYTRIDRLIIDSQAWEEPTLEFERLLAAYADRTQHFVIHDLNWTRTFHLRLAIAAGFEDPIALKALGSLQSIQITHSTGYETTASLLGAWLLGRLPTQTPPKLLLKESVGSHPVTTIVFNAMSENLIIERTNDRFYTWIGTGTPRHFPADKNDLSLLLIDQLGRGGNNAAYLQVAKRAMP
ncbi:MAG: glucose-6-phosphate dehydrogenase assembly protein OpcA [Verrucomicrobiales bacterium]|jgi:glucose-6-phosphate dehydrogenase assembly protein OpcA